MPTHPNLSSSAPLLNSMVRTGVPLIVGVVGTFLARIHLDLDSESLTIYVTAAITFLYYVGVRIFEEYVAPKYGWLLGLAKAPRYSQTPETTVVDQPPPGHDSGQAPLMWLVYLVVFVVVVLVLLKVLDRV
jgi:hypothetical protein